jgi:hypothetical protein
MMGSTYSNVKGNLDKEWKFYRYCLITEFIKAPASPPQLTPFFELLKRSFLFPSNPHRYIKLKKVDDVAITKIMKIAREKYVPFLIFF